MNGTGPPVWRGPVNVLKVKGRYEHKILFGKPEGKSPLKSPKCIWENNILVDLTEKGSEVVD
jgi:hypothetical protein